MGLKEKKWFVDRRRARNAKKKSERSLASEDKRHHRKDRQVVE